MVRLGVGGIRQEPAEVLLVEGLKSLVNGAWFDLIEFLNSLFKSPFHDHANDRSFPVRTVKLGHALIPGILFFQEFNPGCPVNGQAAAELHVHPIANQALSPGKEIRVRGSPCSVKGRQLCSSPS